MTDIETLLAREYSKAKEYYESNFRELDENAIKYFDGDEPVNIDPNVKEYFTKVVSTDVANVVEHTLADIMPAFASEAPVVFPPQTLQDEKQAQVETALVNNIFLQKSDGFVQLTVACKDAVLRQLGVVEVQTYEKLVVSYQTLENVTLPMLASFTQSNNPEETITITNIEGEIEEDEFGNPINSNLTATLKRISKQKQLYIEAFPPDELIFAEDTKSTNLDTARFVARERLLTASELIELGFDRKIVESLPDTTYSSTELPPHRQKTLSTSQPETYKLIRVAFCYYFVDEDDDGIAERRKFIIAGDLESSPTVLEDIPCNYQPFAVGIPFIYPHRVRGISLFEKIKQVQDVKTKIIRQLLSAGELAVKGRIGVVGNQANEKDLRTSTLGGIVRLTNPNAVVNLPTPPFPAEVANLLGIMDTSRKESGGSAVDKANEQVLIGGDTAHGLERIMSAMEQLNSLVAKTLAETLLRQLYVKIHTNLREHFSQPIDAKIGGNWIVSTPTTWPLRDTVSVAIGLTMGDRLRQAQQYTTLLAEHKEMLMNGSILATEQQTYSLLIARANALMIPHAYEYYVDPSSPEGKQAAKTRADQQKQKQEMDRQVQMMNMQLLPQIESIKAQSAATVQMMKNELEKLKLDLDQKSAIAELAVKYHELGLQLAELNAKYDKEPVPDTIKSTGSSTVQTTN